MSARTFARIKVTREGGVETIAMSNPQKRNAIGPRMANELIYALEDARASDDVRVIVLTGEGNAFCAGGDFAEMTSGTVESDLPPRGDYSDLLLLIARFDKPIVARVNGVAMGGGFGLAAASTIAIASSEAKLGTPEIDVGLFPMMIMAVLSRIIPRKRLVQMMLYGEKITADEALRLGVLNEVVAPSDLDAAVKRAVDMLLSKSPLTTRLGLRAHAAQEGLDLDEALPLLRGKLAECLGTDDAREGLMAFLEKRKPVWTGK